MNRPAVVSEQEWQAAREALLVREKELTHELDALAAQRRRMPMTQLDAGKYRFTGPDGETDLAGLFDGRRQLIIYHFMLEPGQQGLCGGCCTFTDNLGYGQWHLNVRETTLIVMARAPREEMEPVWQRFGWTVPFYSSYGSEFNDDLGLRGRFGLSVLLRDGDEVFRTYFTTSRGVDRLRLDFSLLDLTPYGRQEQWEDSPHGWPQTPTMRWLRLHDEY